MATVGVHVVQMEVGWNPEAKARRILHLLADSKRGDIVVTPEGSVSGYPAGGSAEDLARIEPDSVDDALELLQAFAQKKQLFLWVGVVRPMESRWVNEAVELSPERRRTYRKRNLADTERQSFEPGAELPTFAAGPALVSVQICRELRFPEQWIALASGGAQVLLHLNYAVGAPTMFDVWRARCSSHVPMRRSDG